MDWGRLQTKRSMSSVSYKLSTVVAAHLIEEARHAIVTFFPGVLRRTRWIIRACSLH